MKQIYMREAFSMITAIFVILIMASIGAFVMNIGGKIVKSTTIQYQHEQAELYSKSYTEYAILAVTGHDRTANCLENITGLIGVMANGGYNIKVHIAYIGRATELGTCDAVKLNTAGVVTLTTPITLIIDAYVDYQDPDNAAQTLTVHRRTVQKI